jgi:hypothetical protein
MGRRRRRKRKRFEIDLDVDLEPALLVALLVALVAMLCLDRPLIAGDSFAHLMWLDSIAMDGDLALENQVAKFAMLDAAHVYRDEQQVRWTSPIPLGAAVLLAPFYRLASWLDALPSLRVNDAHFTEIQGLPFAYSLCIMLGANLYMLVAVVLGYHLARRFASPRLAALATVAIYLGTPLLFYTTVEPLNAHGAAAFSATLLAFLWLRVRAWRPRKTWRDVLPWSWVGLSAGLAAMCGWQMALMAVPVGLELLLHGRWRKVLAFVTGFVLLAWVGPYSGWLLSGSPSIALPLAFAPLRAWRALVSSSDGLFPWSPVTLLALVGLWPLLRRDWRLALIAAVMFLLQALSGGVGHMAELYPVYVLLLGVFLEYLALHERGSLIVVQVLAVACVAYGVALLLARLSYEWAGPPGERLGAFEALRYGFSSGRWRAMWPLLRDHVGVWAWKEPGM